MRDNTKANCWEFMKCGREPGGLNSESLGVCPATTWDRFVGVNGGRNAGRVCWAVVGTLCGGEVQATYAKKIGACQRCPFYSLVTGQEGRSTRYRLPERGAPEP